MIIREDLQLVREKDRTSSSLNDQSDEGRVNMWHYCGDIFMHNQWCSDRMGCDTAI